VIQKLKSREKRGLLLFSHMEKGSMIIYTPNKSIYNSYMTLEESEDLENKVSQLKNQVNEMGGIILKLVDFSCY
jgi:hypothetical protein